MGATDTQIQAVIDLGDASTDGVIDKTESSAFNSAYGALYSIDPNNPEEYYIGKRLLQNDTLAKFVSAEAPLTGGGNNVRVTLNKNVTSVVYAEWEIKINGTIFPSLDAVIENGNEVKIKVGPNWTIKNGDTVSVSHLYPFSGVDVFTDEVVVNNTPVEPSAPTEITDMVATDDETGQVTITFTPSTGEPSPNWILYRDGGYLTTTPASGYIDIISAGTYSYQIIAQNSEGTVPGNIESGTSL